MRAGRCIFHEYCEDHPRMRILVTGSAGLVGSLLVERLRARGEDVVPFDLRDPRSPRDILDPVAVARAVDGVDGIVHLAAISRVAWGEMHPAVCQAVNADGAAVVAAAALASGGRAWLVLASSREVYGDAGDEPMPEDARLRPVNAYGRSKCYAEAIVAAADLPTAILRLSSVYGGPRDHPDRVVPSLTWRALEGLPLIVTGADAFFDFTHVEDTADGLIATIDRLAAERRPLPPINLATGVATTLGALAETVVALTGSRSPIVAAPRRGFDVAGYRGSTERARRHLGWRAAIDLKTGIRHLVQSLRRHGPPPPVEPPVGSWKPPAPPGLAPASMRPVAAARDEAR